MKIKIPEGSHCINCPFSNRKYYVFSAHDYHCGLFNKSLGVDFKHDECYEEFGDGGEFELVRIEEVKP